MTYNWMPTFGDFTAKDRRVTFRGRLLEVETATREGREVTTKVPAAGAIISDQPMTNGVASAVVTFKRVGPLTGCELIVGYDVATRGYLAAGITGMESAMYAIREWYPGVRASQVPTEQPQWIPYNWGGDRSFLRPNQAYALRASLQGSSVVLEIDGVQVATTNLRYPFNRPRPTGIWCSSDSTITIDKFTVDAERPLAFVVMHFAKPYDEVYSEVIRNTCINFGLEPVRADEIYGPGLIINDIVEQIHRAQVIIAEITPENANVYFEVGYAYAWKKPIVLLARENTELPFDVSAFRVLFYEDSIGGRTRLEEGLSRHLKAILGTT